MENRRKNPFAEESERERVWKNVNTKVLSTLNINVTTQKVVQTKKILTQHEIYKKVQTNTEFTF